VGFFPYEPVELFNFLVHLFSFLDYVLFPVLKTNKTHVLQSTQNDFELGQAEGQYGLYLVGGGATTSGSRFLIFIQQVALVSITLQ
jgi:hypothetical protein